MKDISLVSYVIVDDICQEVVQIKLNLGEIITDIYDIKTLWEILYKIGS